MVTDANSVILRVNRAFTEITGYTAEEVLGKTPSLLQSGRHDQDFYREMWQEIKRTGIWQGEVWDRRKNGEIYPKWLTISTVKNEQGIVTHYVGTHLDISAQKSAEAEIRRLNVGLEQRVAERTAELALASARLQQSSALVAAIVDTMVDGLITIDDHGTVETYNKAAEQIFGYSSDEVVGQNISMLMPEPYLSEHDGHLAKYRATGKAHILGISREVMGRGRDGSLFPLELSVNELLLGDKLRFVGTVRDITERKLAESLLQVANEELSAARDVAQAANDAKSVFLATMSHEIRTPMNGVIGMLEMLQQSDLKSHQLEMLDTINESAFSLLDVIEDILDFSKIEAGKLEIESVPISISEVVEKACAMLDTLAVRKDVFLTVFVAPTIPATVIGDATRLRQIVVNLINNAIKFSSGREQPGRVSVRANLAANSGGERILEISVADNGIGMSEELHARLFQAFTQADASTTRQFGGSGLGLAIVHKLVALMNGAIAVVSAPGQGATFTVRLPCISGGTADADANISLAGLRCLVIGDDSGLADDWTTYLLAAGAMVERTADIAAAQGRPKPSGPGPWVWLLDAGATNPEREALRAIVEAVPEHDLRFVIFERGRRQQARRHYDHWAVVVDANALSRQGMLTAVAIAAGRSAEHTGAMEGSSQRMEIAPPAQGYSTRWHLPILVAEDNEINRKVISQQLNLLGFATVIAGDGKEALQLWENGDFALLLTDLNMPNMDGYELSKAIRQAEAEGRHLPIVALTANALTSEEKRCKEAGMDDYLSKPVTLARLQATLKKWLPVIIELDTGEALEFPVSEQLSVLDTGVLANLVGEDPALIEDILKDYQQSAQTLAAEIRAALAKGDMKTVGDCAHKLKSSSRAVGALALGEVCARMDQADRNFVGDGPMSLSFQLAADFETALAAVLGELVKRRK